MGSESVFSILESASLKIKRIQYSKKVVVYVQFIDWSSSELGDKLTI